MESIEVVTGHKATGWLRAEDRNNCFSLGNSEDGERIGHLQVSDLSSWVQGRITHGDEKKMREIGGGDTGKFSFWQIDSK